MANKPPDQKSEHFKKPNTPDEKAGRSGARAPTSSRQQTPSDQKYTDVSQGSSTEGVMNIGEEVQVVLKRDEEAPADDSSKQVGDRSNKESGLQSRYWILTIDPAQSNFPQQASYGQFASWSLIIQDEAPSRGDQVLFFLTGDNSGIYGWGEVFEVLEESRVDATLNSKFRFPLPLQLTRKLVGPKYHLDDAKHQTLFSLDEATFFEVLFEAGRFGNRLPRYSADNLDAGLSDETIAENEWLDPLKENMLGHGFTVFSLWQRGIYFRTQGLPSIGSKENNI